jgi:hypothetical protein
VYHSRSAIAKWGCDRVRDFTEFTYVKRRGVLFQSVLGDFAFRPAVRPKHNRRQNKASVEWIRIRVGTSERGYGVVESIRQISVVCLRDSRGASAVASTELVATAVGLAIPFIDNSKLWRVCFVLLHTAYDLASFQVQAI